MSGSGSAPQCTNHQWRKNIGGNHLGGMIPCFDGRVGPGLEVLAQFTRSYNLTTALAPLTLRVWLTICLWAALLV